jgi:GH15 family glucan-1,4-alpha-glucosidase
LDEQKGGEFSIFPQNGIQHSSQYYLENTNILCTTIESSDGSYMITDFAPRFEQYERYYKPLMLIRKVEPISGHPKNTGKLPSYL